MDKAADAMAGRELARVVVDPDKMSIGFEFKDGGCQGFVVSGDCCSRSWIEHIEFPLEDGCAGLVVTEIVQVHMGNIEHDGTKFDCLQAYETRFRTAKGDIVLEYRNDSNGYYGGDISPVWEESK